MHKTRYIECEYEGCTVRLDEADIDDVMEDREVEREEAMEILACAQICDLRDMNDAWEDTMLNG